jgi:serine/threonine-protein kinase HipA
MNATAHVLGAFDGAARVGGVGYDSLEEQFSFTYDPAWPATPDSYSISPHILMAGQPASSGTVRRFLENLLPEGRALDVVATTHQVSKNNIYGLVRALGHETSGALALLPDGATPQSQATSRREVTPAELKQRIDDRSHVPFAVWDGRARMSIAGYQDKLPVYMEEGHFYLVEGELASTHILKPEPEGARLPMLVANEHFGLSLAARLGLAVAPVSILRLPNPVLVIQRFDRVPAQGRVRRLHVIDACQALNLPVSYKYERNFGSGRDVRNVREGVSFARLFSEAVAYTVEKAVTRQALVRWALFNYLIGNADAHGKNVSFFCRSDGLALAPFYDLVSVVQYEGLDHELAMAYGDEFQLGEVSAFAWADFALRTGTPRPFLAREMRRRGSAAADAAAAQVAEAVYVGEERAFVERIAAFVREQAQKLAEMATPMTKVNRRFL